jgi:hypothetical protein
VTAILCSAPAGVNLLVRAGRHESRGAKGERLGQVRGGNPFVLRQIRDRACDAKGPMHRANRQAEPRDGFLEEKPALVIERTMLPKFLCREVGVAESSFHGTAAIVT